MYWPLYDTRIRYCLLYLHHQPFVKPSAGESRPHRQGRAGHAARHFPPPAPPYNKIRARRPVYWYQTGVRGAAFFGRAGPAGTNRGGTGLMAKVWFIPADGTLAAYLSGEIDHHAAQSLRREIDAQVDAHMPDLLALDFSGVTFMDSSGVGLILGRGRYIASLGGRLTVQNPPAQIRKMLDLARIQYV